MAKTKPEAEAPEPDSAGVRLSVFVYERPVPELGQAVTLAVGSEYAGGKLAGICEAVVAFPEGVVATFALGERTLPADPKATRRRMLFTAAGYGFLEDR